MAELSSFYPVFERKGKKKLALTSLNDISRP
jgi:hypothetical protein